MCDVYWPDNSVNLYIMYYFLWHKIHSQNFGHCIKYFLCIIPFKVHLHLCDYPQKWKWKSEGLNYLSDGTCSR